MNDLGVREPSVSVVVPAFNEQGTIQQAVSKVISVLTDIGIGFEVIVVDDGSSDSTWLFVEELIRKDPRIRGIKLSRNFGKESAICAGLSNATGSAAIVMDADLQHPPNIIPKLIDKWQEGHVVVEAVKQKRGREGWINRASAKIFYVVFSRLSGFDLESHSDFKLLDRQVIDEWKRLGERTIFFRGMTAWLGFPRAIVPFDVSNRTEGESRWTPLNLVDLAVSAITSFSSIPLRLITVIGGLFLILAFLMGVQTLYVWATGSASVGFTTVILLVLFSSSVLMIALGIIGEYLARIYEEVKARPRFVIEKQSGPREFTPETFQGGSAQSPRT